MASGPDAHVADFDTGQQARERRRFNHRADRTGNEHCVGGGRQGRVRPRLRSRARWTEHTNEGQHIEYEIEENRGKTSAVNLKVK